MRKKTEKEINQEDIDYLIGSTYWNGEEKKDKPVDGFYFEIIDRDRKTGKTIIINPFPTETRGKGVISILNVPGWGGILPPEVLENIKKAGVISNLTEEERGELFKDLISFLKKKFKSKKSTKLRSGGHLIDNILKSNKPKTKQLDLFETMQQDTKNKVLSTGTTIDMVNRKGEGIKLSKGEYKLLLCLQKLLHDKSQTIDSTKEDYYLGNQGADIIKHTSPEGAIVLKSPKVSFTFYEITKEFYGGSDIGGENVKTVAKLLYDIAELPEKKALIRYHKKIDLGKGKEREYFIERYDSLVSIATAGYRDYLEGKEMDEKKEIIINLHPIFIDQIAEKYIELPLDLTKRMIEANGSQNISEITTKFIYELARAHSNRRRLSKDKDKNPLYTIGQETLYYKIAESYMPPNRKRLPLIKQYLDQAIETAKAIGILLKDETEPSKIGELNYVFTLPKNWD
jgi:hypothetical protein